MKVLTDKTFTFVDTIWETYMEHNMVDVRYIYMYMHVHMHIHLYTVCVDIMCIRGNAWLYCVNVVTDTYILDVHFAGLYLGKVMGVTVMKTI